MPRRATYKIQTGCRVILPLLLLGLGACQKSSDASDPKSTSALTGTDVAPTPAPSTPTKTTPQDPKADDFSITSSPNGQIRIAGKDRWAHPFDTTYESRDFLRNALPILERSLSADQIAALRKEAGPAPGAADDAKPTSAAVPKPAPAAPAPHLN